MRLKRCKNPAPPRNQSEIRGTINPERGKKVPGRNSRSSQRKINYCAAQKASQSHYPFAGGYVPRWKREQSFLRQIRRGIRPGMTPPDNSAALNLIFLGGWKAEVRRNELIMNLWEGRGGALLHAENPSLKVNKFIGANNKRTLFTFFSRLQNILLV